MSKYPKPRSLPPVPLATRNAENPFVTTDDGLYPVAKVIENMGGAWQGVPIWVRAARDRGILQIAPDRVQVVIPKTGGQRIDGFPGDLLARDDDNMVRVVKGDD